MRSMTIPRIRNETPGSSDGSRAPEQLSGARRGYLKRDLNEKASAIIREITGGKYTKLVTDEKLHVSLVTDEKLVEIEQVSPGNM